MSAIGYDVATALWQGARPYQEDTLLADFHGGVDRGFAILADGMGGHAAGDLASRLVVIDAASHLKFLIHDGEGLEKSLHSELSSAITTANDVLRDRAADDRRLQGMGTTFLATVIFEDRLYWASVGDSPLYLWREGALRQLNEDHSMAPVIDQMAKSGEITREEAANHPDRNALTSVLMGRSLKAMDVPETATVLDPGDVLIQASDGLQYLDNAEISQIVGEGGSSAHIAAALIGALKDRADPMQDNTALLVLQLTSADAEPVAIATGGAAASSDRSERAVGTPAGGPSPRAQTPTDVARPAGGRRWVLPAGVLGGAAAAALGMVMFGLPNGGEPDLAIAPTFEPAIEVAAVAPEIAAPPVPAPAPPPTPAPPPAPAGSGAAGARIAAVPSGEAAADVSGALGAIAAPTALGRGATPLALPTAEISEAISPPSVPDKFATGVATADAATLPFGAVPSVVPLREGINAPSPGTAPLPGLQSQRGVHGVAPQERGR
ncbi:protein phosphatase 2C domain-containing protein [Gymnodinialimonas sp. 57CJ19]|uniref:PP2C family protein-serine/threonine phosphatase n=1 Tax=Gymnodinialimonas sp. 57CJ19 TaxID=3138498 RepID=UPI0031344341